MPPVDTSSKPSATRPRPRSARPVLSDTDRRARRGDGSAASARAPVDPTVPAVYRDAPASSSATARGSSRCSTALIRSWSDASSSPAGRDGLLGDDRPAVERLVDEMDRRAGDPRRPAPARRGPRVRRGTRAAATDGCSGSARGMPQGPPDRRSACSRRVRRRPARPPARVSATPSSAPPGMTAVSIPCSAAQSIAGHGRSANTRTIVPPSSPRAAAAWRACRFEPAPETPTAIRNLSVLTRSALPSRHRWYKPSVASPWTPSTSTGGAASVAWSPGDSAPAVRHVDQLYPHRVPAMPASRVASAQAG